ncbi:MAG: KAP family P-loop NTPase fold protein [Bacteroidota bacterium]
METIENYFNLYVESIPDNRGKIKTITFVACNQKEILKYFNYIKQSQYGYKPFGNQQIEVVVPELFYIFDFSKTNNPSPKRNKEGYKEEVRLRHKRLPDYLSVFRELGDNVTSNFGIHLEDYVKSQDLDLLTQEYTTSTITTPEGESEPEQDEKGLLAESMASIQGKSNLNAKAEIETPPLFPTEFKGSIVDSKTEPSFRVEKVAQVFARHIENLKDENGQMVGVFGQWGRGKTYFIDKVFENFKSESSSPFIIIKFQAWKYQQMPSIWAYLFETFIAEYLKVGGYKKWIRIFKLSVERNGHWKTWIWPLIGVILGLLAIFLTPAIKNASTIEISIKIAGITGTILIAIEKVSSILKKIENPAITIFNSITKVPSFKSALGIQAEIQKELISLIISWGKYLKSKRILLFVDDLDRCAEGKIIEIIDSLRVILDDEAIKKQVLILIALDENKLEKAISKKYENLFSSKELPKIVGEYMDKLFISAIKLYPISFDEREEFVRKLAAQINSEKLSIESKKTTIDVIPTPISTTAQIPDPMQASEVPKSNENLEDVEVTLLQVKIKLAKKDLTPRQIRILIYRYLLARNLWIEFYGILNWESEEAIDEIMRYSNLNNQDSTAQTTINGDMSKIARMVVAY